MKENNIHTSRTMRPQPENGIIEVGSAVDFVYIMRKDGDFTMSPIAAQMANEYSLNEQITKQILLEEYDIFFAKLADTFQWGFSEKGRFELHIFDPSPLDKSIRQKAGTSPIISLDPLLNQGVYEHEVSRGYYLSGKQDFGQIARPGSNSLEVQAIQISDKLQGEPAVIAEDDIFSGGSVIASLETLVANGISVKKITPGIQIGKPEKLSALNVSVDPVVIYETGNLGDVFDKVDLGDPRDYLLGASGLVIKLPNGEYGRAPYILPFVSSSARASILQKIEKEFSLRVLQANFEFFHSIEEKIGKPILLSHMNPDFIIMMNTMFGFDKNTSMDYVVTWALNNLDTIWNATQKQGELQEKLADLELPHKIVFVDVNGTLFSDDSPDGYISEEDKILLRHAIDRAKDKGLSIGLCSDSPLPQLRELAHELGIHGPIAAENGNILYNNGKVFVINPLANIDCYKQLVIEKAQELGIQQTEDSIAKEFGGNSEENLQQWSFGANRIASVTVFGPSKMIQKFGEVFGAQQDISFDCSPEYHYFAIHPGNDYKQSKGNTLSMLTSFGHNIVMVGNSMSDWVDPNTGAQCAFVANSRITSEATQLAAYISDKTLINGVIDIMNSINLLNE